MSTTFEITRGDLAKALTIGLKFAGKDSTLPMLCGIDLSITKRQFVVAGTDRFRFGLLRLDVKDLEGNDGRLGFLERSTATFLLKMLNGGRSRSKLEPLKVKVEGSSLTIAGYGRSVTVDLVSEEFPDVTRILTDQMKASVDVDNWAVNTDYFADFKGAAWNPGDSARIRATSPSRAVVVMVGEHFIGIIMPVRSMTPYEEKSAEWAEFLAPTPEPEPEKPKRAQRKKTPTKAVATAPAKRAPTKRVAAKKAPVKRAPKAAK
ncbi:MAG: hypothetical protein WA972_04325 [Rhodococcus qingshengii]